MINTSSNLGEYRKSINESDTSLTNINNKITQLETSFTNAQNNINNLQTALANAQNTISSLQTSLTNTLNEINSLKDYNYRIKTYSTTMTLTNTWQDTGVTGNSGLLESGTYLVTVGGFTSEGTDYQLWSETYTGIMYWYTGGTNSSNACEIHLHNSGHADNTMKVQLRTLRQSTGNYLKLQIYSTYKCTASTPVTFKFKRLL